MSVDNPATGGRGYSDQAVRSGVDILNQSTSVVQSNGVYPEIDLSEDQLDHKNGHDLGGDVLSQDSWPAVSRDADRDKVVITRGASGLEQNESNAPVVEAALLLEGHPATPVRLSRITGLSIQEIESCLGSLRERYSAPDYGLQITRVADSYSITPKAELWGRLGQHYGNGSGKRLSRAAMETLTIVAYSQPVTRSQIEAMRGVSADAMIRLLCDRQLIRSVGYQQESVGRPTLFGTTNRFLETFGLETIDDLPRLDRVEESRFQQA